MAIVRLEVSGKLKKKKNPPHWDSNPQPYGLLQVPQPTTLPRATVTRTEDGNYMGRKFEEYEKW
jgi:hypothetical protein